MACQLAPIRWPWCTCLASMGFTLMFDAGGASKWCGTGVGLARGLKFRWSVVPSASQDWACQEAGNLRNMLANLQRVTHPACQVTVWQYDFAVNSGASSL